MDVTEAINKRRSVRKYSPKALGSDVLEKMRCALRSAPSAGNYQPWRFIFVMNEQLRRKIAHAASKQTWMADAPVIIVACGWPEQAYKHMGGYGNSVDVDLAIAVDHLTLAAVAEGLGTCWIGSFGEDDVKQLLGVPKEVKIVAMTPLGYPASPDAIAPLSEDRRKKPDEIFSVDQF